MDIVETSTLGNTDSFTVCDGEEYVGKFVAGKSYGIFFVPEGLYVCDVAGCEKIVSLGLKTTRSESVYIKKCYTHTKHLLLQYITEMDKEIKEVMNIKS